MRGTPNIWTMAVRQQQYQIDVRSVEELFGQQEDARGGPPASGTSGRVSRSRSFKESSKDEVSPPTPEAGIDIRAISCFITGLGFMLLSSNVKIIQSRRFSDQHP